MESFAAKAIFEALDRNRRKVLVIESDVSLTGQDLLSQSASVAYVLMHFDVKKNRRVLICVKTSTDGLILWLAVWRLGAIPIITDIRTPSAQLGNIIRAASVDVVVSVKSAANIDGCRFVAWEENFRFVPTRLTEMPDFTFSHDDPAMYNLSSGTTGQPKIYVRHHNDLLTRVAITIRENEYPEDYSVLTPMSLGVMGTRIAVLRSLLCNGLIIFYPILFSASELIEALLSRKVSATRLPPVVIHNIIKEVGVRNTPIFGNLEMGCFGGGPTAQDNLDAYRYLTRGYILNYSSGLTGTVSVLSGDDICRKPDSTGKILNYVHVDILEPESRAILPMGETGLIRVKSHQVVREVINPKDAVFDAGREEHGDGWGIPGDIGFVDKEGFLTIVGRANDMIVRGGANVSPMEVETILLSHPKARDVGVVGVEDPRYGQEIVAFVVAPGGCESDIEAFCIKNFSSEKRPRKIYLVESLPYNSSGKLMRAKLRDMLPDHEKRATPYSQGVGQGTDISKSNIK